LALIVTVALTSGWFAARAWAFDPGSGYDMVGPATAAVARVLPTGRDPVLVCITSADAWPTSAGVVANLRRNGRDLRISRRWLHIFGPQLAATGRETTVVFLDAFTPRPLPLPVGPLPAATGGGLRARVYQAPSGFVTGAICPTVPSP
jgi:hypothetical protein